MPVAPTYPGVYVQEVPSGVRTIVGVSTSTTLFIGRTESGPMDEPTRITTYTDFVRSFGEDNNLSDTARYVKLFFLNGGTDAYVMRSGVGAGPWAVDVKNVAGVAVLRLPAKHAGKLGNTIRVAVTYAGEFPESTFNIEVFRWETDTAGNKVKSAREEWRNLSMDPLLSTYAPIFLTQKSALVNAAELGAVAATNGFSLSGRPIEDDNSETGAATSFVPAWNAILGNAPAPATPKHSFQISVDGSPFVEVTLHDPANPSLPPDVAALAGGSLATRATNLADLIHDQVLAALAAKGITLTPTNDVQVDIVGGPTGATLTNTRLIRIASMNGKDVRVASSSRTADDLAGAILWGTANGGLEGGSQAARRPAATGVTFMPTQASLFTGGTAFGSLAQTDITKIQLTEVDPATGALVNVAIPTTVLNTGGARMWNDASGASSFRGIREKLGLLRDAINGYQAANPSKFYWRAELWGYRLALLPQLPDENYVIPAATLTTTPKNLGASFLRNVRYYSLGPNALAGQQVNGVPGDDGKAPKMADYDAAYLAVDAKVDLFNLLVLPPEHSTAATPIELLLPSASAFCLRRRAFLVMDPPDAWTTTQKAATGVDALRVGLVKDYSAVYFPRLLLVENGITRTVGPAGAIAGLYARIDTARGVWKAAAGTEADIRAVSGVDLRMSDAENGQINPVGVNGVRLFPDGVVSWGARTMAGSDQQASEYKYVPVRRLALYIEESLYRGLKWVVFEPNDVALWAQIRLNVGVFMQDLFRKGAFQGSTPSEAYFVKVDAETTTQNDRNLGIVNIWVGFAPVKPAEFVILYLQQIAGQLSA
jgi:phage tail sheath protein FI